MKIRYSYYLCVMAMLSTVAVSCKSVIEEDVSGDKVSILAPTKLILEEYNQTFWWEVLEGVTSYEVQIVSKSFTDIEKLILDSTVTGTKLTYTLVPGDYEWRIRGINGSYKSEYNGSKFTILVSDIKKQYVQLTAPANNASLSSSSIVLSWKELYGSDGYRLQVDKTGAFTTGLSLDQSTPATSYVFSPSEETTYYWRVKAFNIATDSSSWSSVYAFTYDISPPAKVVLTSPANNLTDIHTETGTLQWTSLGAGIKYIVYVKYGTSTEIQSSVLSTNSYSYSGASGQIVLWKVKAIDAAGNEGIISDQWQFKID